MGEHPHFRSRRLSIMFVALAALTGVTGVFASWLDDTVFDATSFSRRAVAALDSESVRHELALQLTDQLVKSGNRQVIAFRPAAVLAAETLIDTDTFRSIFANAARRTHASLLTGSGNAGLDLTDSLSLLSSGLQLTNASKAPLGEPPAANSLTDIVDNVAKLPVWEWRATVERSITALLWLAAVFAALSVVFARDRRRSIGRLGIGVACGGVFIHVIVLIASHWAQGLSADRQLSTALQAAVWSATIDLRAQGFGLTVVGLVVAAAATTQQRFSPGEVRERTVTRFRTLRSTTRGSLLIVVAAATTGVLVMTSPRTAAALAAFLGGLALIYYATRVLVSLVVPVAAVRTREHRRQRFAFAGVALIAVLVAVSIAVLNVRHQHARAENTVERRCLGRKETCDLRIDHVTLAGSHNAMSSPAYPGWLFGEQSETIGGQLNAGVRALLIDAHYGRLSSVKLPASDAPLVITDVAAEFAVPGAEVEDPVLKKRAEVLAAKGAVAGRATRDVYLCHNHCELGAVRMVDELGAVRRFLDENPGELVMLIVQDAVASPDVARAFEEAGLLSKVATLTPGEPLPTVGDLIDAGTPLLVFAERGDKGAPAWYHRAYEWFQETTFTFRSPDEFTCGPNRGNADNPLFLLNHWVSASPPDPAIALKVNSADVLARRLEQCLAERGRVPNVIAADFSTSGDVVRTSSAETLASG